MRRYRWINVSVGPGSTVADLDRTYAMTQALGIDGWRIDGNLESYLRGPGDANIALFNIFGPWYAATKMPLLFTVVPYTEGASFANPNWYQITTPPPVPENDTQRIVYRRPHAGMWTGVKTLTRQYITQVSSALPGVELVLQILNEPSWGGNGSATGGGRFAYDVPVAGNSAWQTFISGGNGGEGLDGTAIPEHFRIPGGATTARQDTLLSSWTTGPRKLGLGLWDRSEDWDALAVLTGKSRYALVDGLQEWLDDALTGPGNLVDHARGLGMRVVLGSYIRPPYAYRLNEVPTTLSDELASTYDRYFRNRWTERDIDLSFQHYIGDYRADPLLGPSRYGDIFETTLRAAIAEIERVTGKTPWITEYGAARSWIRTAPPGFGSERDRMAIMADFVRRTEALDVPGTALYTVWNRLNSPNSTYSADFDFGLMADTQSGADRQTKVSLGVSQVATAYGQPFPERVTDTPPGFTTPSWLYDDPQDIPVT